MWKMLNQKNARLLKMCIRYENERENKLWEYLSKLVITLEKRNNE